MSINRTYLAIDFKNKVALDGGYYTSTLSEDPLSIYVTFNSQPFAESTAVKAYIDNRLNKIYKQFDELISATIFLLIDNSLEKALQHTVELTIHFKNTQFYSESHGEDLYQTIDSVIKKMWE